MDSTPMPDPASGETLPELGQPSPGELGGLPGAGSSPELAPDPAVTVPAPEYAPAAWHQASWGLPPGGGAPPPWGLPPGAAGLPAPAARRRGMAFAFGGALIIGGLAGALVMAEVGNVNSSPSASSSFVPSQQAPSGNGPFSRLNPFSGGAGSSSGATGGSSTGSSGLDAASIAAKVDPALVDITSVMSDGTAAGTGMVLTSGGQVLTNNHVIQGAVSITAQIAGTGRTYTVRVLGADPANDVALLQLVGASNLKTVSIGDATKVAPGDPIVAIGNALGRSGTPATAVGSIVAVNQSITATDDTGANPETLNNLIQVDANVLPGDSGGPLVDASGKVVGMDTAASSSGRGFRFQGVTAQGFAIPINAAITIVQQLRNGGGAPLSTAQTALLGVDVQDAAAQGGTGALVVGVQPGTPAQNAGIAAGDVITGFGGRSVTSQSALSTAVKADKPGDHVSVSWLDQSGQQHSATVQLAGQSAPAP